jgi:hypothetical protein
LKRFVGFGVPELFSRGFRPERAFDVEWAAAIIISCVGGNGQASVGVVATIARIVDEAQLRCGGAGCYYANDPKNLLR